MKKKTESTVCIQCNNDQNGFILVIHIIHTPSLLMGDDFTNSDRGDADADLWTFASEASDFDSAADLSRASRMTTAIAGADLDNVSGLNGPSLSCSSRSFSFSSITTSDNSECRRTHYSTITNTSKVKFVAVIVACNLSTVLTTMHYHRNMVLHTAGSRT